MQPLESTYAIVLSEGVESDRFVVESDRFGHWGRSLMGEWLVRPSHQPKTRVESDRFGIGCGEWKTIALESRNPAIVFKPSDPMKVKTIFAQKKKRSFPVTKETIVF